MIDLDDIKQLRLADRNRWQLRALDSAALWQAAVADGREAAAALPPVDDVDLLWLVLPPSLQGLGMATSALFARTKPAVHLWRPTQAMLTPNAVIVDPYLLLSAADLPLPVITPSAAPLEDAHPVAIWGYLMALLGRQTSRDDQNDLLSAVVDVNDCAPTVPVAENRAKQMAHRLYERIPVFWGEDVSAGVALDWRHRYIRYSESRAEWAELAGIRHVEVMARFPRYWPQAGVYVQLAQADTVSSEIVALHQLWQARRIQHEKVVSTGETSLAAMFELLCLGEWVALYAAALIGVDPAERIALDFLEIR